jgi:hypothetical protein
MPPSDVRGSARLMSTLCRSDFEIRQLTLSPTTSFLISRLISAYQPRPLPAFLFALLFQIGKRSLLLLHRERQIV